MSDAFIIFFGPFLLTGGAYVAGVLTNNLSSLKFVFSGIVLCILLVAFPSLADEEVKSLADFAAKFIAVIAFLFVLVGGILGAWVAEKACHYFGLYRR